MELDLLSFFGLYVHSCTHWLRPRTPPPPHLGSYMRALLVIQERRHLFVPPWYFTVLTLKVSIENVKKSKGLHRALKVFIRETLNINNKLPNSDTDPLNYRLVY
jgi:hypothetical protein